MLIATINKQNVIFTDNKNTDINSILTELKLMKKDGTGPYKHVNIQQNFQYKFVGSVGSVDCVKITSNNGEYYVFDNAINIPVSGSIAKTIANVLNPYGSYVELVIDGSRLEGKFKESDSILYDVRGVDVSFVQT